MVARPKTENAYSGSSITVLEGLEAVRKRPGMYIGSTGERGLHHMVWEVVDNAVDEALAGYCDTVRVTLMADGGVRVEDNGRGFPVDMHPVEKRPTLEVIMTVLHAGGKFDGKSYGVSGGLHGVGVTVVNALSKRLEVNVWRDGAEWFQRYDLAKPGPLEEVGPTKKRGSAVTFWADGDIFETTDYSFDTINRRLQEMAFLNKGLTIILRDERPGHGKAETGMGEESLALADAAPVEADEVEAFEPTEITYRYDGGLVDYVAHLNARKTPIHKSVIGFSAEGAGKNDMRMSIDVAMQWSDAYSESVYTFANIINTHEGGTHEEGFRAALTSIVNRYAVEKKLLQGEGREAHRRRHPRGSGRDRLGEARRPAVRGPDQDQARQHRGQGLRPAGLQRADRPLVRGQPDRGQDDHHQGVARPPAPAAPRRTPASWPARACSRSARCRASWPTAGPPTRATPRSTSSRATRPAARPSPAATRCSRRSCPSAARSSTSRRRASTGSSRTTRSSR